MREYKTIMFSDYVKYTSLREFMTWDIFDLVELDLPEFALDRIQDKALALLCREYGYFNVGVELVDNTGDYPKFYFPQFEADLMTYFPELIQSLSITLKMLGINVPEVDTNTDTFERTESISNRQESDNALNSETDVTNENKGRQVAENTTNQTGNSTTKNTGTSETEQDYEREIVNSSEIEETGNKNVSLNHAMPEQALNNTGNFDVDSQGTPDLGNSYVQSANENFSTMNPMITTETSIQRDIENRQTTTNDLTQSTNNSSENVNNSELITEDDSIGKSVTSENSKNIVEGEGENIIHEVRTTEKTNPMYANEIAKFLESMQSFNAFENFIDKFEWLCGIL